MVTKWTQNGKLVACSSVSGTPKIMKKKNLTQFGNATHIASTDIFFIVMPLYIQFFFKEINYHTFLVIFFLL